EATLPLRQVLIGLKSKGAVETWYYHRGSHAPRSVRKVGARSLTPEEQYQFASPDSKSNFGLTALPDAYTKETDDSSGRFVYTVPDEPVLCCVVSLPARDLYPSDVEEQLADRIRPRTLFSERRVQVRVEPCGTFRRFVYRATYRFER